MDKIGSMYAPTRVLRPQHIKGAISIRRRTPERRAANARTARSRASSIAAIPCETSCGLLRSSLLPASKSPSIFQGQGGLVSGADCRRSPPQSIRYGRARLRYVTIILRRLRSRGFSSSGRDMKSKARDDTCAGSLPDDAVPPPADCAIAASGVPDSRGILLVAIDKIGRRGGAPLNAIIPLRRRSSPTCHRRLPTKLFEDNAIGIVIDCNSGNTGGGSAGTRPERQPRLILELPVRSDRRARCYR